MSENKITAVEVDWSKVKIHCSAIGKIMVISRGEKPISQSQLLKIAEYEARVKPMTEKQKKEYDSLIDKRDNPKEPPLSRTAKLYLRELYAWLKYGKRTASKDAKSKFTAKGKAVEEESITLLSRLDKRFYVKNCERKENDYISGECDIYDPETSYIKDIKSSWDLDSLLSKIEKPVDSGYWHQVQGYMELWGAEHGEVSYCLVNTPPELVNDEKYRLFKRLNPVTEEDPEYKKAAEQIERDLTFDDMPIEERVVKFYVEKDHTLMPKVYRRVQLCREWLAEFEKRHLHPELFSQESFDEEEIETEEE